jgi:uncharacterized protein (TIRG00374 family)
MNRATIVRGIQIIVAITLITFGYIVYHDEIQGNAADLSAALANVRPGWLALAAVLALQEGVCGGLRMFFLGRVLCKDLRLRTAIVSEFVLMFCAGVTPGQAGAAPAQVGVLVHGGMRFVDVATAELLTGLCTVVFFLGAALVIWVLRTTGNLAIDAGHLVDPLLGLSVTVFGSALVVLVLCAAYPPLLKSIIRVLAVPCGAAKNAALDVAARIGRLEAWANRQRATPGAVRARLIRSVDEIHEGFRVYLRRGKRNYAIAQLLTFGFFCSRFAVAYFILLGLGIPTSPTRFVTIGPPIVQVVLVQALLNFALYLSPTPGASGIAELGSKQLMSPWVSGAYALPYLVLWRILALFLCMFVGGVYVFRYLGTDVLEEQVKEADAQKRAHEAEHLVDKAG